MIKITLPDGSVRDFAQGTTPLDVAKSISEGLARNGAQRAAMSIPSSLVAN